MSRTCICSSVLPLWRAERIANRLRARPSGDDEDLTMLERPPPPWHLRTRYYLSDLLIRALIRSALVLPLRLRLGLFHGLVAYVAGPVAGYLRLAEANLAYIFPEMSADERRQLARACLGNAGRTFIEIYHPPSLLERLRDQPMEGPGLAAMRAARESKQPIMLTTAHFGNYMALNAALEGHGFAFGGLYRDMSNPYFNAHYVQQFEAFQGPFFARGSQGNRGFLRHLRAGGQLALAVDQHSFEGEVLQFLGKPALTAVSAAELAIRFGALLVPAYAIRQKDGTRFRCIVEAPIPHSDPKTMMQAVNDSISAQIRAHPEQWLWFHRRWRPEG